ncbi:hypothetical protein [Fibrella arboris]|uniref:hypothetical protein n=1 Tax=Fibrella arboris TaxID=3242486 RepID=UPI003521604C
MMHPATKTKLKPVFSAMGWLILIVNTYPVGNIILLFGNEFDYVTKQGRWSYEDQFKGQRYEYMYGGYWQDLTELGYEQDGPLYRTTPINLLKFWRWTDYAIHPRWRLPYNDQPDTLRKGPVHPNPEKVKLWNRIQQIDARCNLPSNFPSICAGLSLYTVTSTCPLRSTH